MGGWNVETILSWLRLQPDYGLTLSFRWRFWGIKKLSTYRFFKDSEVDGLDKELVAMLDMARAKAGVPFRITSGFRTAAQNAGLPEAVQDSAHLTGNAVDLACSESHDRYLMLKALLEVGFKRIGVYKNHLHADNSTQLLQGVIWHSPAN